MKNNSTPSELLGQRRNKPPHPHPPLLRRAASQTRLVNTLWNQQEPREIQTKTHTHESVCSCRSRSTSPSDTSNISKGAASLGLGAVAPALWPQHLQHFTARYKLTPPTPPTPVHRFRPPALSFAPIFLCKHVVAAWIKKKKKCVFHFRAF